MSHRYIYYINFSTGFGLFGHVQGYHLIKHSNSAGRNLKGRLNNICLDDFMHVYFVGSFYLINLGHKLQTITKLWYL